MIYNNKTKKSFPTSVVLNTLQITTFDVIVFSSFKTDIKECHLSIYNT